MQAVDGATVLKSKIKIFWPVCRIKEEMTVTRGDGSTPELLGEAARAIRAMNRLRELNANSELDIPTIVFAGKQSAGKSSLVEALTGVQLPRNSQTCTRCPIQVTTVHTKDTKWQCTISLIFDSEEATDGQGRKEFCVLTKKERPMLADRISQAQEAALGKAGVMFTRNTVCVEIRSMFSQDLSLLDLPGLIASTEEAEDAPYVDLVRELVKEKIGQKNTVILQCMSADDDMENQAIRSLAMEVDPQGLRSLGVITKPDRVERGTEDNLIEVFCNLRCKLKLGYYMVRTPTQLELNSLKSKTAEVAFSKAKEIEKAFFEGDDLGRRFRVSNPARCGSSELAKALKAVLIERIQERLPNLKCQVEAKLKQARDEKVILGTQIPEAQRVEKVLDVILTLTTSIGEHIKTLGDNNEFWRKFEHAALETKAELEKCIPEFKVDGKLVGREVLATRGAERRLTMSVNGGHRKLSAPHSIGVDKWIMGMNNGPHVELYCHEMSRGTETVEVNFDLSTVGSNGTTTVGNFSHVFRKGETVPWARSVSSNVCRIIFDNVQVRNRTIAADVGSVHTAEEVLAAIQAADGRSPINGEAETKVAKKFIVDAAKAWRQPSVKFVEKVKELLLKLLLDRDSGLVEKMVPPQLRNFKDGISTVVDTLVKEKFRLVDERVRELCDKQLRPYTINKRKIMENRSPVCDAVAKLCDPDIEKKLVEVYKVGFSKDDLQVTPPNGKCDPRSLEVIASTLAYCDYKLDGFVDGLVDEVVHNLFDGFHRDFRRRFMAASGIFGDGSEDKLTRLCLEDPTVTACRKQLDERIGRLEKALKVVTDFMERNDWEEVLQEDSDENDY